MMVTDELGKLDDEALISAVFDLAINGKASDELKSAVVWLVSAVGILENGGLRYFMESDFPDDVSHDDIGRKFSEIGMTNVSVIISQAAELFPGGAVIANIEKRNDILSKPESIRMLDALDSKLLPLLIEFSHVLAKYIREHTVS